jgi:hypothetical protein
MVPLISWQRDGIVARGGVKIIEQKGIAIGQLKPGL